MLRVESRIQDGLRLTSSVHLDRVITATVDSVTIKIALLFFSCFFFFFQTVLNSTLEGLCYLKPQLHTASQEA